MKLLVSHDIPMHSHVISELVRAITGVTNVDVLGCLPTYDQVREIDLWVCGASLLETLDQDELIQLVSPGVARNTCVYGDVTKPSLMRFIMENKVEMIDPRAQAKETVQSINNVTGMKVPQKKLSSQSNVLVPGQLRPLTQRQIEVMQYICDGLTAKEIAQEMNISPGTVTSYAEAAFMRLGCTKKMQAVAVFMHIQANICKQHS